MCLAGPLRSNAVHTRCSFRSDFDIKQEPVIKPSSSGKHPGCHEIEPPPPLNLLHIYTNPEQESLPLRLADARTWSHAVASGATSYDPGCVSDWQRARRINICLCEASATLVWCQLMPEAWICHDTVYCFITACTPLVKIADKQQLLSEVAGIILEPDARLDCSLSKWRVTSVWISQSRPLAYDMYASWQDAHQRISLGFWD